MSAPVLISPSFCGIWFWGSGLWITTIFTSELNLNPGTVWTQMTFPRGKMKKWDSYVPRYLSLYKISTTLLLARGNFALLGKIWHKETTVKGQKPEQHSLPHEMWTGQGCQFLLTRWYRQVILSLQGSAWSSVMTALSPQHDSSWSPLPASKKQTSN